MNGGKIKEENKLADFGHGNVGAKISKGINNFEYEKKSVIMHNTDNLLAKIIIKMLFIFN